MGEDKGMAFLRAQPYANGKAGVTCSLPHGGTGPLRFPAPRRGLMGAESW